MYNVAIFIQRLLQKMAICIHGDMVIKGDLVRAMTNSKDVTITALFQKG